MGSIEQRWMVTKIGMNDSAIKLLMHLIIYMHVSQQCSGVVFLLKAQLVSVLH